MGGYADALGRTFRVFSGDWDALALFGVPHMGGFADALGRTFRDALV